MDTTGTYMSEAALTEFKARVHADAVALEHKTRRSAIIQLTGETPKLQRTLLAACDEKFATA